MHYVIRYLKVLKWQNLKHDATFCEGFGPLKNLNRLATTVGIAIITTAVSSYFAKYLRLLTETIYRPCQQLLLRSLYLPAWSQVWFDSLVNRVNRDNFKVLNFQVNIYKKWTGNQKIQSLKPTNLAFRALSLSILAMEILPKVRFLQGLKRLPTGTRMLDARTSDENPADHKEWSYKEFTNN